ncbi:PREDICTED: exophilin-5 [Elephantulus edwardii]|uniref:exophilin-5 n=1 Tax=Elephantulus edwardii TaxID=28737 RepID=UPI0003F0892E|nr:PREDICTED: exophilin-5 [Elephantulus edwardii]
MTKVPHGFDFSFLNDEEARKILHVLERNEELQRTEKERISKLQKTKRDIRWLQGVTGEWFEEIQRKKFCNETDVSQMLKPPLTYRLQRGMAKNEPVDLQTSRAKNVPNPKAPASFSSRLNFRSSFASLFSFRKSGKESLKLPTLPQKRCDGLAGPSVSVRESAGQTKINSAPLGNQPVDSAFVTKPAGMREGGSMPPWDASLLENEFLLVLDDLDSKLAQEQSSSSVNIRAPFNYESRTQFSRFHSSGNRPGNTPGRHKNRYNETSNMSIYDILRPGAPREGFKTFAPRTRTIYDMYRTREPRVVKEDYGQKNTFGSSSLCFDSRQQSASPATRHFTARSLHFPATTQSKSGFISQSHRQSPKRTPLSSIIWNRSDPLRDGQNQREFPRAPSPMEIDPADQYTYPSCFQEKRRYEFYRSQSAYQSVNIGAPMESAMSPDPFENTENMPFYHQDNPFARAFFSNTFGQSREQIFEQSSFWGQREDHSSLSDFYSNRNPFTSFDRDFDMISIDTNSASAAHGRHVPSQHWESSSPAYEPNVYRDREEPCPRQFDFQASTLEGMEVSQGSGTQLPPYFNTAGVCPMADSSYRIKSDGLECQQDTSPRDRLLNKDAYAFEISQPSSSKTSFPQTPDDKKNPQHSEFQTPRVTLQEVMPNEPAYFPGRSHSEVKVTYSDGIDSSHLADSQSSVLVTEENNEKSLDGSTSEKCKQLIKVDQTSMAGEMLQPVLQMNVSNPLPEFQNPFSQDSAENNRFVFNAPTTISSKRSPRVLPRKDISKIYISPRDKANELRKGNNFSGDKNFGSATSPSFLQDHRTSSSYPASHQGVNQESGLSNENITGVIDTNHQSVEFTDNQNSQTPRKPNSLDPKGKQCAMTQSISWDSAASHHVSRDRLDPPSGALQDSTPLNKSFLGALVNPPTVFSRRSSLGNALSPEERREKNNTIKNQKNSFTVSPFESQKENDSCVSVRDKGVNAVSCHSHHPFRDGKGKGRINRRISCIENVSKLESQSTATNNSNLSEVNRGRSKTPEPHPVYCTLPRKSPSFLLSNLKSESKVMGTSFRNGPLPFQIRNHLEDPIRKYTSNQFSPSSPESENTGSKGISDSTPVAPAATERMVNTKITGIAPVRKGPPPFLVKRTVSCPSGESRSPTVNEEREKCSVSEAYASAVTAKSWERIIHTPESDSSVRDCSLNESNRHKEHPQESTEKEDKTATPRAGTFSLPNEDPFPLSGKEGGETLQKYKTTSLFSVSGDDDHVKCLEVVSIYYTLPRKYSKKFSDLLQKYTQNTDSLTESLKAEVEMFPSALQNKPLNLNCSAQEEPGTLSSEDPKMAVEAAQEKSTCLSNTTEEVTVLHLPNSGSSGSVLPEMVSGQANASLPRGASKVRETFPDNFTKAPQGDSQSRKKKGKKLPKEALHTPLVLQTEKMAEDKLENCQPSIKSGNCGPSGLAAHSADNAENSQTLEKNSDVTIVHIRNEERPQKESVPATSIEDCAPGSQGIEVRGKIGIDSQEMVSEVLSNSEKQGFNVTPALHGLQVDEEIYPGELDEGSLQSEPKEIPHRSQKGTMTDTKKFQEELQRSAWDQPLFSGGISENKASLDVLEKGKNRSLGKYRLAAVSRASRKFPGKDLSPRRHVATIFTSGDSRSSIGTPSTPESKPPPSEPTLTSDAPTDDGTRLSKDGVDVEKFEPQVAATARREPPPHLINQNSNTSIAQPHWSEFMNISESPPNDDTTRDVSEAQTLEREPGTLAQPIFINFREAGLSAHQRRLSSPRPLEPILKSPPASIPLASCQQQQRSAFSPEQEPEPHLYRSKSLRSINMHGDKLRISHPPKVRERHCSENTSVDDALSRLTLGSEFSVNNGYSRRFRSFSELPSCDEGESWALYDRMKTGPKSATSISRPIDYGIFGKEQQLAFLENVKRSLTQGRLWKPSFLKNPGFLKNDITNPSNPSESSSPNSPSCQMPEDGLSPNEPLNIYEDDPVGSDCDTDTTTDDEYYLDENDKESEL